MAIFIDRRPKLDKVAIAALVATILIFASGLKGCRSDYARDKLTESNTAVCITSKESHENGQRKYLNYKVGEHAGQISVTDETFNSARPGKTMYFMLSKRDYEGDGWLITFGIMIVIGGVGALISLNLTIAAIHDRYF